MTFFIRIAKTHYGSRRIDVAIVWHHDLSGARQHGTIIIGTVVGIDLFVISGGFVFVISPKRKKAYADQQREGDYLFH